MEEESGGVLGVRMVDCRREVEKKRGNRNLEEWIAMARLFWVGIGLEA